MITEKQKEIRRRFLGSSDAAAIVGLSPWKTAADVYHEKIKTPSAKVSTPDNDAIIVGSLCERAVLDWFQKETGLKIKKNQRRVHPNSIMAASLDALVVGANEIVEAKTTGITSWLNRDEWGEIGTDQVPQWVIAQCHHQLSVMGPEYRIVWVPVLLGGVGFRMYKVERNNAFASDLEEVEVKFWREYVEKKTPPPDSLPSLDTLKRIERLPAKTVQLPDDMVVNWAGRREILAEAKKLEEEAKQRVLTALGDAEVGESSLGKVTYYQQSVKEKIIPACTFRVCRFQKNKENKNGNESK